MLLSLCFTFLSFKLSCFFFLSHFLNKNLLSFSLCLIPSQTSHVEHKHFCCEKCTLALLFILHFISFIHLSKQYVLVFSLSRYLYFSLKHVLFALFPFYYGVELVSHLRIVRPKVQNFQEPNNS